MKKVIVLIPVLAGGWACGHSDPSVSNGEVGKPISPAAAAIRAQAVQGIGKTIGIKK